MAEYHDEIRAFEGLSMINAGTGLAITSATRQAFTVTASAVTELTAGTTTLADTQCVLGVVIDKLAKKGLL